MIKWMLLSLTLVLAQSSASAAADIGILLPFPQNNSTRSTLLLSRIAGAQKASHFFVSRSKQSDRYNTSAGSQGLHLLFLRYTIARDLKAKVFGASTQNLKIRSLKTAITQAGRKNKSKQEFRPFLECASMFESISFSSGKLKYKSIQEPEPLGLIIADPYYKYIKGSTFKLGFILQFNRAQKRKISLLH
ncbi:MAG: hypothetical protein ABIV51_01275 [Saprospiraceae bacterium]